MAYFCDAADFDGSDYMQRAALAGIADSKKGILSAWLRLDGSNGSAREVLSGGISSSSYFEVYRTVGNLFEVVVANQSQSAILTLRTVATYTAGAAWRHLLCSWDLATAGARHLYMNDVSDLNAVTFTNDTGEYDGLTKWTVGDNALGNRKFDGAIAELFFAPGQYLDFSVAANRRLFITAQGYPVDLGSDGSVPLGVAPVIYQRLAKGEAVANFATNRGTGGNFTITGTLDTASSSPSDGSPILPDTGHVIVTGRQPSISFILGAGSAHNVIRGSQPNVVLVPPLGDPDFDAALVMDLDLEVEAANLTL